jgi:hypothetical protein
MNLDRCRPEPHKGIRASFPVSTKSRDLAKHILGGKNSLENTGNTVRD